MGRGNTSGQGHPRALRLGLFRGLFTRWKTLASGEGAKIELWDVTKRVNVGTIHENWSGESVTSVSFSPDGAILASGAGDHLVKLWDAATRANIATLAGHTRGVRSVAFSPDGATLASSAWSPTVRLWNTSELASSSPVHGGTPVCDRTPEIRDRILAILNSSTCNGVTWAHLETIEHLNLQVSIPGDSKIAEIMPDDFSGLSSLRYLHLGSNQLSSLPVGVFSDLALLQASTCVGTRWLSFLRKCSPGCRIL